MVTSPTRRWISSGRPPASPKSSASEYVHVCARDHGALLPSRNRFLSCWCACVIVEGGDGLSAIVVLQHSAPRSRRWVWWGCKCANRRVWAVEVLVFGTCVRRYARGIQSWCRGDGHPARVARVALCRRFHAARIYPEIVLRGVSGYFMGETSACTCSLGINTSTGCALVCLACQAVCETRRSATHM